MASSSTSTSIDSDSEGNLCGLPDEIWLKILLIYSKKFETSWRVKQLLKLGRVSKKMGSLARDASLWTNVGFTRKFPPMPTFKVRFTMGYF